MEKGRATNLNGGKNFGSGFFANVVIAHPEPLPLPKSTGSAELETGVYDESPRRSTKGVSRKVPLPTTG
jgi:hypothetical protein